MNLVFLLEEPSAKDLLTGLLPNILPNAPSVHYLVFEGKQDLEHQLVRKLRGWRLPDSAFVVMRDQDGGHCREVRSKLVTLVEQAQRSPYLVRVACREIESWVIGDWSAVASAFDRPTLASLSAKEPFRDPDSLYRPVEWLRKHIPEYQKRDGARRIGGLLDPSRNLSRSFQAFCKGLGSLVQKMTV